MTRLLVTLAISVPILVGQSSTTVQIVSSANPSVFGQGVTLTASVNPPQATGKVTFYDGTTVLGIAALTNGQASLTTILLGSGRRLLKARFAGGGVYGASISAALGQTVNVVPATTLQAPTSNPTANGAGRRIAVADFNGDGRLDIVTTSYTVLMGNGDGAFRPPAIYTTSINANDVVTGDFNGDGRPDFATAGLDSNLYVWMNKGDGTFQTPVPYLVGAIPLRIIAADFNNDGVIDLAVASRQGQGNGVGVLLGVGDGTFRPVVTYLARKLQTALAVADFNGDGNADIVSVDGDDVVDTISILLGNGDGTFHVTATDDVGFPEFVATGDFNNDGRPDFVVLNYGVNNLVVFLGNGDGTFHQQPAQPLTPTTLGPSYADLALGDFDGDGNLDIAYTGSGTPAPSVFVGNGDGTFHGAVNFTAGSGAAGCVTAADFNGDGRTDLAVCNPSSAQILLAGTGSFPTVTTMSLPPATGGVPYSSTLNASGGTPPYTWTVSAGRPSVPVSSTGTIAGTPSPNITPGPYPFTVMVSGANGMGFNSSQNLSIQTVAALKVVSILLTFEVGVSYPYPLGAMGGTPPYQNWTITAGALPPGMMLDPASGTVSGIPTAAGIYSIKVTVTDSVGLTTAPTTVTVGVIPGPSISMQPLPNAGIGVPYRFPLAATGGVPPYTNWTISSGALPPGLALDASSGIISGTPTTAVGSPFAFSVAVSDFYQVSAPQTFTIAISSSIVPQSGWWWDPNLNGEGFFIEYGGQSGNGIFMAGFFSDASGNPTWLVSTGSMNGPTYTSTWLKASGGQTLLGLYRNPTLSAAGAVSITFSDTTHGVLTRPDGTMVNIERYAFSSLTPPEAGTAQVGWWWGGSALSGTGYAIEVQGSSVFIAAYVYDGAGNPIWYLATGSLLSPTEYNGTWDTYAGGPQLSSPEGTYPSHKTGSASPVIVNFFDAAHGALTMDGMPIPIVRYSSF